MALQNIAGRQGFFLHADGGMVNTGLTSTTLDAAGESRAYIGQVFLEGGSGSKTISSAGGKILWRLGTSVTFANAGTTVRVGIQDVGATGFEDGTFDVYDDLIGGTDTLTSSTDVFTNMSSGTKTITHGDIIAIVIEMTAKGGTDSVPVSGSLVGALSRSSAMVYPYVTTDTGTPAKSAAGTVGSCIVFDDGTIGWIGHQAYCIGLTTATGTNINTGSTPDEIAAVFQLPFKCRVSGGYLYLGSIASTDTFEIVTYTDPLGTPAVVETLTPDPDFIGSTTSGPFMFMLTTPLTISPNTDYAVALRPTSANNIIFGHVTFGSGNGVFKKALPFGTGIKHCSRSNQTGAFAEIQDYNLPLFGIFIDQLDDGVSTGGEVSFVS